MEDEQQFCLRWNNHQSTLISVIDTLLENETLVDCTLAAEGKFLKAHKVVLSACSPYFAKLLSEQYDKHPIFILKDVKYQELRAMMDYMYRGEVNISQDQLAALLKAAESLQIKGLSDNRTGGSSNIGIAGVGVGGQQQKTSVEQHKHINVPGKMLSGSAASGYTLEQTKRSRIGPSSIDSQDLSGSREGSSSPTSRRRKKVRRRSIENVMADNHDNSNSSQIIQAGTSSIVPTTNAAGTITAMVPVVGGSAGSGSSAITSGTIASSAAASLATVSGAANAANIITANVTKKTDNVKMGNTDAMNTAAGVAENVKDESMAEAVEKDAMLKEKQNHKRSKHDGSVGKEPEIVIEPKSEYDDDGNDETVEDLTLDDEEMGLEDLEHNAGPSHGGEGSSQGYAQWQVDRSQDEVFMAAQEAQQRDPQDYRTMYNIAASAPTTVHNSKCNIIINNNTSSNVDCGDDNNMGTMFEPEITIRRLYKSCRKIPGCQSSPNIGVGSISNSNIAPGHSSSNHNGCGSNCSSCSLSAAAAAAASLQLASFIGSQMLLPNAVDMNSQSPASAVAAGLINSTTSGTGFATNVVSSLSPGGGGIAIQSPSGSGPLVTVAPISITTSSSTCTGSGLANTTLNVPKKSTVQFNCIYCSFVCSWKYDLKMHLRQKHGIHKKKL